MRFRFINLFSDIDECANSPCFNGGSCVDLIGGFRCECPVEWTGEFCDKGKCSFFSYLLQVLSFFKFVFKDVNECESNSASAFGPCINADGCENLPGGFNCVCQKGWTGETCSININDCVGVCENGATCTDLLNDYYCSCPEGFKGLLRSFH